MSGRPTTLKRSYEVSADGQTLTIHSLMSAHGREQQSTLVLLKQPDAAGEPLRTPEETAEAHFKNVKTEMKTLPASQFIDNMRYFAWSLNKDCEFCHVKDHFDSDDKKEKQTARKMIEMTDSIDQNNFDGHPDVRCFTCHEGHNRPLSRPLFPDEVARAEAAAANPRPGFRSGTRSESAGRADASCEAAAIEFLTGASVSEPGFDRSVRHGVDDVIYADANTQGRILFRITRIVCPLP